MLPAAGQGCREELMDYTLDQNWGKGWGHLDRGRSLRDQDMVLRLDCKVLSWQDKGRSQDWNRDQDRGQNLGKRD